MQGLLWYLIEAVCAVGLLVGIVWSTWPRTERDAAEDVEDSSIQARQQSAAPGDRPVTAVASGALNEPVEPAEPKTPSA